MAVKEAHNPALPAPVSSHVTAKAQKFPKDKHGMPKYHKASHRTRLVRTTSFSHMENEPGAPGRLNASGGILKYGTVRSAAADWSVYPLGTTFKIKGQPHTYVVDDYGSSLVGTHTIDIFKPSLSGMRHWGTRPAEITIIQWGSYERSLKLLKGRTRYPHCYKMYVGCKRKLNSGFAGERPGSGRS
ncbi:3D domain-containing protein [Verrucomicrobiaceae bacterium N1E253]|uniref:3D domain-containing protein n=1 Tax=Oceaniferula marina TaxID=2748318 RepID=A0A851GKI5_9BACT|nr:3D domain-containing protein [Oceaniferula marina]NWK57542.1 3D domain-containing protein [Oceaniferula marina]